MDHQVGRVIVRVDSHKSSRHLHGEFKVLGSDGAVIHRIGVTDGEHCCVGSCARSRSNVASPASDLNFPNRPPVAFLGLHQCLGLSGGEGNCLREHELRRNGNGERLSKMTQVYARGILHLLCLIRRSRAWLARRSTFSASTTAFPAQRLRRSGRIPTGCPAETFLGTWTEARSGPKIAVGVQ